jgi:hypothetical protein
MPSADQVPVELPHLMMRWHKGVVLMAGSTSSALRAVRPPNLHITRLTGLSDEFFILVRPRQCRTLDKWLADQDQETACILLELDAGRLFRAHNRRPKASLYRPCECVVGVAVEAALARSAQLPMLR